MTNQTYKLAAILDFFTLQDPAGDWSELEAADATKADISFMYDTLTEWITEGLEVTPKVQDYLDFLKEEIQ